MHHIDFFPLWYFHLSSRKEWKFLPTLWLFYTTAQYPFVLKKPLSWQLQMPKVGLSSEESMSPKNPASHWRGSQRPNMHLLHMQRWDPWGSACISMAPAPHVAYPGLGSPLGSVPARSTQQQGLPHEVGCSKAGTGHPMCQTLLCSDPLSWAWLVRFL